MLSLYDIENQFMDLFATIEEQGGEITPEQEEYLRITDDNFKAKLEDYAKVIKDYEGFINICKEEEKRINTRRKVYENRIKTLKDRMVEAIEMFAPNGKSIETGTFRLSIRNSKSTAVSDCRVEYFKTLFNELIKEMAHNGMINIDETESIDYIGMLNVINANAKAECEEGEEFVPYTIADLENIKINISRECTVKEMLDEHQDYLEVVGNDIGGNITASISKTESKRYLEANSNKVCSEQDIPSVVKIEDNKSLFIK